MDSSEISDVNSDELARMVEDMDNLDKELFNEPFRRSKTSATNIFDDANLHGDGQSKKKVVFKDYKEHDSRDSLPFEEDSPRVKTNPFTASTKTSVMEDLFKLRAPNPSVTSINTNQEKEIGPNSKIGDPNKKAVSEKETDIATEKTESSVTLQYERNPEKTKPKTQSIFNNDDDILESLLDKPRTIDSKTKRSLLIEDLFENRRHSTSIKDINSDKNPAKSAVEHLKDSTVLSLSGMQTTKSQNPIISKPTVSREPRRGRRNSKIINDPLGLLQSDLLSSQDTRAENEQVQNPGNTKLEEDLPEWLGGVKKQEERRTDKIKIVEGSNNDLQNSNKQLPNVTKNIESNNTNDSALPVLHQKDSPQEESPYPEHFSLLLGSQLDQQSAIMSMQQQEHELRTAMAFSQQNEQLHKIVEDQKSKYAGQEKQFNALITMQLERQALLEKQMQVQQERIERYIRTLMAQPSAMPILTVSPGSKQEEEERKKHSDEEEEKQKNLIQELQSQVLDLETTLKTVNARHENEMTIQAECYKRQITFLHETMDKFEKRARQEVEYLEADYEAKFEKLRNEMIELQKGYKEETDNLKRDHARHIEDVYEQHSQTIKLLQKENSETIENISKARHAENTLVETMTNRKNDIINILEKANQIIEHIKISDEQLLQRKGETEKLRENYLSTREEDVKIEKINLEKQKSALEVHRNKFVEATERLESQLTQSLNEFQKGSALYKETHETLEKKEKNLLKERETFEEYVNWERNHLQTLKDFWMKEVERQIKSLAEEKETIAVERAQLDVLVKLKTGTEDITKVELESALKAAKEACTRANQERLRWQENVNDIEMQRQELRQRERILMLRAKELDALTQVALTKKEEGIRALREAKYTENQQREKFAELQTQMEALIQRERKIAVERFNVTRNRFMSRTSEMEKPEKDTRTTVFHNFPDDSQTVHLVETVDPTLIMLKLSLDEQLDASNKYLEIIDS